MATSPVIVAEKDPAARGRLVRALAAGFIPVVATGSAAALLEYLLHNDCRVVVIGNQVEERLPLVSLVRLVKRCNPSLSVILVADEVSLGQERTVRHAGIFFRTTWPDGSDDWSELQMAVACAMNKNVPFNPVRRHRRPCIDLDLITKGVTP